MTKIYIVSTGDYSDYCIMGVYSTHDKAIDAEAFYAGEIQEFELDEVPPHPKGLKYFRVEMPESGEFRIRHIEGDGIESLIKTGYMESGIGFFEPRPPYYVLKVWAKDTQHAAKIANEKRSQIITSGEWEKLVHKAIKEHKNIMKTIKEV